MKISPRTAWKWIVGFLFCAEIISRKSLAEVFFYFITTPPPFTIYRQATVAVGARADVGTITNLTVTLDGMEIASLNGEINGWDAELKTGGLVYLTNSRSGQFDLVLNASNSNGTTSSRTTQVNFPSRTSIEILEPRDGETIYVGQDVNLRIRPNFDFGGLTYLFYESGLGFGFSRMIPINYLFEEQWLAQLPGTNEITIRAGVSQNEPIPGKAITVKVAPFGPPTFYQPRVHYVPPAGGSLRLESTFFSEAIPTYQWLKNGELIPNATNSFLAMASADATHNGAYSAIADTPSGTAIQPVAVVTVQGTGMGQGGGLVSFSNRGNGIDAPVLGRNGAGLGRTARALLFAGTSLTNMMAVSPAIPLSNGYFQGGTIALPNVKPGQNAYFQVYAWEDASSFAESDMKWKSKIFEVTAGETVAAPLIGLESFRTEIWDAYSFGPHYGTVWFQSRTDGRAGKDVVLQTVASARFIWTGQLVTNFTYQWFKNGDILPNETNSFFEIKNITRLDVADYSVVVSEGMNVLVHNFPLGIDASKPKLTLRRRLKNLEGEISHAIEVIARLGSNYSIERSSDMENWAVWRSETLPERRISAEHDIETDDIKPTFYRVSSTP